MHGNLSGLLGAEIIDLTCSAQFPLFFYVNNFALWELGKESRAQHVLDKFHLKISNKGLWFSHACDLLSLLSSNCLIYTIKSRRRDWTMGQTAVKNLTKFTITASIS